MTIGVTESREFHTEETAVSPQAPFNMAADR